MSGFPEFKSRPPKRQGHRVEGGGGNGRLYGAGCADVGRTGDSKEGEWYTEPVKYSIRRCEREDPPYPVSREDIVRNRGARSRVGRKVCRVGLLDHEKQNVDDMTPKSEVRIGEVGES